jgi:CheY-like chemotaxis protein
MEERKPKILIVDDEAACTRLMKLLLSNNYDVCEENNSVHALETARKFQPDLILLDVVMPVFDGGDVAAQLQADPVLKRVPIVFLTATVTEKETEARQLFGGYPFIAKPVRPEKLAESIERSLAGAVPPA